MEPAITQFYWTAWASGLAVGLLVGVLLTVALVVWLAVRVQRRKAGGRG